MTNMLPELKQMALFVQIFEALPGFHVIVSSPKTVDCNNQHPTLF